MTCRLRVTRPVVAERGSQCQGSAPPPFCALSRHGEPAVVCRHLCLPGPFQSVAVGGFPTLCPQGHNSGLVSLSGQGQLLLSDGFRRALTWSLRLDFTSKMAFEQIALCSPREPRFTYQVCLCRGFSCRPDLCLAVWLKSLFLGPQRKPSWVKQLPAAHYRSEGGRGVRE